MIFPNPNQSLRVKKTHIHFTLIWYEFKRPLLYLSVGRLRILLSSIPGQNPQLTQVNRLGPAIKRKKRRPAGDVE